MSQPKYQKGVDYRFNGTVPDLPINIEIELIYFCNRRQKVKMTKDNKALWHPRPMHDPQIKAFCIVNDNWPGNYYERQIQTDV